MNYGQIALEHANIEKLYRVLKGIERENEATSDEVQVNFYDTGIVTISVKGVDIEYFFDTEDLEDWIIEKSDENKDNRDTTRP